MIMCSINSARGLLRPHCAPAGVSRQPRRHGLPKRQEKQEWDTMGPNLKNLVTLQWRRYEITRNSRQNGKIWESMGTRGENSVLFFPLNLLIHFTSARPGKLYSIPCADTESLKPNAIALVHPIDWAETRPTVPLGTLGAKMRRDGTESFPCFPYSLNPGRPATALHHQGNRVFKPGISLCSHSPLAKPAPSL